jgi:hypothetical protein
LQGVPKFILFFFYPKEWNSTSLMPTTRVVLSDPVSCDRLLLDAWLTHSFTMIKQRSNKDCFRRQMFPRWSFFSSSHRVGVLLGHLESSSSMIFFIWWWWFSFACVERSVRYPSIQLFSQSYLVRRMTKDIAARFLRRSHTRLCILSLLILFYVPRFSFHAPIPYLAICYHWRYHLRLFLVLNTDLRMPPTMR